MCIVIVVVCLAVCVQLEVTDVLEIYIVTFLHVLLFSFQGRMEYLVKWKGWAIK